MSGNVMRRRDVISGLGGVAMAWPPLVARAQQATRLPIIGYLGGSTPSAEAQRTSAFVQRLRELDWIEGRTVTIQYRWSEGRSQRFREIAAEFVRLKVDAIITAGIAVPALKQATTAIPIVFAIDADPVGRGLVESLARPGGNVTGLSLQSTDLVGKRLELLREIIPRLHVVAALGNAGFPGAVQEMGEVQTAGRTLGIEIELLEIRSAEDIGPTFGALKNEIQALYVCGDALVQTNQLRINTLALGARLPMVLGSREYVERGGLLSYGPNFPDLYRRSADHIDKILRGTKPADIPVEQPTKFELVVNLTTAKALGLSIPEAFLLRADEVIE